MFAAIAPVAALLLSVALLIMGNGLQGTLLPVRAHLEQFSTTDIGLVGTAYFFGFGLGCYFGSRIVRRAGHIRTFSAMASVASAIVLVHATFLEPVLWWVLRCGTGFCFAVLYVVIESWLNERASNENRGLVFSVYTVINLTVITLGQLMLVLADPASFPLFVLASVLVSLAVLPVSLTTSAAPAPIAAVRLRLGKLYRASPVGFAGALAVGCANGAFWSLAPVFAQQLGFAASGIAVFMSVAVLAGAAAQLPLGRASDRRDRRHVIVLACAGAALGGIAMAAALNFWPGGTYLAVALFGAMAFPLYAIAIAHANDLTAADEFVETSSALLLLYAIGATVGPIPASLLMGEFGPQGLFVFTAVVHALLAGFTLLRLRQRPEVPETREPFVNLPRTSPALLSLDPRSGPSEPAEDEAAAVERRDGEG